MIEKYIVQDIVNRIRRKGFSVPLIGKRMSLTLSSSKKNGIKYFNRGNLAGIKESTISFIESLKFKGLPGVYRYSSSVDEPTLYSSTHACLTLSLYRMIEKLPSSEIKDWASYLQQSQREKDGLFIDKRLQNTLFEEGDWWGAKHLTPQVLMSLNVLGAKPKYPLRYLDRYLDQKYLSRWLDSRDWSGKLDYVGNEVLNLGTTIQHERDFGRSVKAARAMNAMEEWLQNNIFNDAGFNMNISKKLTNSIVAQGLYHILLLFFYDRKKIAYNKNMIDLFLSTQNEIGGFGVSLNSSACEDIDSIDPLSRLSRLTRYKRKLVLKSLKKSVYWILANYNEDGGFVFRRNEPFTFGHSLMSSDKNESSLFATWFRTLTLAYLSKALKLNNSFYFIRCPGYQFW